jgi:hypothetical protein
VTARRAMATCLMLLLGVAGSACAADQPREVHGSADTFVASGLALAWAVRRGTGEADTQVVIRVDADSAAYASVAVTGVDPFSRARQPLLPPTGLVTGFEFRSPRSTFAEFPRSEFRFFSTAAMAAVGAPTLVVYYLGVPDTTPEFAGEEQLQAYLAERIAQLRKQRGSKTP